MRVRISTENLIMLWRVEEETRRIDLFPSPIRTFIIHILKHLMVRSRKHARGLARNKGSFYNPYYTRNLIAKLGSNLSKSHHTGKKKLPDTNLGKLVIIQNWKYPKSYLLWNYRKLLFQKRLSNFFIGIQWINSDVF